MPRIAALTLALTLLWVPRSGATSGNLTLDDVAVEEGTILVRGSLGAGLTDISEWDGGYPGPVEEGLNSRILGHEILDVGNQGWVLLKLRLATPSVFVPRPPVAYSWPIKIDGSEEGLWLAAGNMGTGNPPSQSWYGWGAICTSPLTCEPVRAFVNHELGFVTWEITYDELGARPGSTIEVGAANGGMASSFLWPATPQPDGTGALGTWDRIPGFKLRGEVQLGIASAGTPADEVDYGVRADLGPHPEHPFVPRAWIAELPAPAVPGDYTVYSRTCWGELEDPTCEHSSADVTV